MNRDDIIRMAREAGFVVDELSKHYQPNCITHTYYLVDELLERFAALVAAEVHKTYSPIGTVAGGATERTFMHPSVKFILPTGLQLYARIEVREEDKV